MSAPTPASTPYPAGTFTVQITVSEGHNIGPGQLLGRVSDGLNARVVAPFPIPYDGIKVTFEAAAKPDSPAARP